jgi:hypothetical protein
VKPDRIVPVTKAVEERWAEYERRKNAWVQKNPAATCDEYQAAMQRIAREVGV